MLNNNIISTCIVICPPPSPLPPSHPHTLTPSQDLEHFISSFNALMEHTEHVEQQLRLEHNTRDVETAEEALERHLPMQDQLKKAPLNTIREGNELLRALEQVGLVTVM